MRFTPARFLRGLLRARPASRSPATPEGVRIYAVGDIHGRLDLLDDLLAQIDADRARSPAARVVEVYLGDYIDRGPDSRGVIARLVERSLSREAVFLRGNHEHMLARFLEDAEVLADWQHSGAHQTLQSFGIRPPFRADAPQREAMRQALLRAMTPTEKAFLAALKLHFTCGDFLFVHAGLRPGIPLEQQDPEDLMMIREEFLLYRGSHDGFVVHGHTPVSRPETHPGRLNIDTGAFASGCLTCARLDAQGLMFMQGSASGATRRLARTAPVTTATARPPRLSAAHPSPLTPGVHP